MAANVSLLECPVCLDLMAGRIYQCLKGHSLCEQCLLKIPTPKKCPQCCDKMTNIRNITVENLVEVETQRQLELLKVKPLEVQITPGPTKINCRYKSEGCKFFLHQKDYESHIEECIFRDMLCPFIPLEKCVWIGKFSQLKGHFSRNHPNYILDVEKDCGCPTVKNFKGMVLFLIVLDKLHFILYWLWDPAENSHQIAVQNIGTKAYARNWDYEVKFFKEEEPRRSVSFNDICTSDSVPAREILKNMHCITVPNSILDKFGTESRFKVTLQKNESIVANNRKGPKCSPLTPP